jgi:peptide/nickel transport system permease protein
VLTWLPAVAIIPPGDTAFSHPKELALPVLTLVLAVVPYLARLHRGAVIEVLESEYVQMARLKGLPERVVIGRHALRNALVPAVQGTALTLIYLTGGVVTIEFLFAYPGLGSALAAAVQSRDLPVVQGIVVLFAATYVLFNLAADVLTVYLSPRLRTRR